MRNPQRTLLTLLLLLSGLCGCAGREADPRSGEDAAGEEASGAAVGLPAGVDSLARAMAAVVAQHGRRAARGRTDEAMEEPAAGHQGPAHVEEAPPRPAEVVYATYRNERLGYTIAYPANLMAPAGELGDGNGRRFAAPDGSAVLAVYAVRGARPAVLRELYRAGRQDARRRVVHHALHDDGFALSGSVGERLFYERTLLRGDLLKTFLLLYDAAARDDFEPVAEHVSSSFEEAGMGR